MKLARTERDACNIARMHVVFQHSAAYFLSMKFESGVRHILMRQTSETSALIAHMAPNPGALHAIMLSHTSFCLLPVQQYTVRVRFRVILSMTNVYESKLPSGRFDGLRLLFYTGRSRSQLVEHYINGERHGPRRSWRNNGRLAHYDTWRRGKLCGTRRSWYENGAPKRQTQYVDGLEHGRVMTWFKSGQLAEQYDREFGNPHGIYMSWYVNGQLFTQLEYRHGTPHGLHLCWYDNGQQKKLQTLVNGERRGDCKRWDRDGTLTKHVIYKYEVIVGDDA